MVLDVYLIDVTVSINIRSQLVKIETRIGRFTVLAVTANARCLVCLVTSHIPIYSEELDEILQALVQIFGERA